jgi:xylulokinase
VLVSGYEGPVRAYLGIDLGTSGLKLALLGEDGTVLAEAEATSYGVSAPQPGYAETDPQDWAVALEAAAAQLSGNLTVAGIDVTMRAIGVTGQMHGVVLTDGTGEPVRPAVLWSDARATGCLDAWTAMDADARTRLSNPIVAGMPGPILTWLHRFEPETAGAAAHLTFAKDWLRGLLTGDRSTERSDASATLLWDVVADDWSAEALQLAGVSHAQLPEVVASQALVGSVGQAEGSDRFAQFGCADVPVAAGGSDVACVLAALEQTDAVREWNDTLVVNLGTGIQVLRPKVAPASRPSPLTHLYADAGGGWYEMVAIQNGGLALGWVRRMLGLDWGDFIAAAKAAPGGSGGATFIPFLMGERGLVAAPGATAGWVGLTPAVGRNELARSAFEALAFTVRFAVEALNSSATSILVTGGGARDPFVRQLIADTLGRPVTYVPLRSASAVGAAALAARAVGEPLLLATDVVVIGPSVGKSPTSYSHWLSSVDR